MMIVSDDGDSDGDGDDDGDCKYRLYSFHVIPSPYLFILNRRRCYKSFQ